MKSKAFLATSLALFGAFAIVSCTPTASGTVKSVTVSADATEVDYKGTLQLSAKVEGEGNFDNAVVWSLSDEDYGTISADGLFTSTTEDDGYVIVYATSKANENVKGSLTLQLYGAAAVTSITVDAINLQYFEEAGTQQATYEVKGTGKFDRGVTFEVEDTDVASVDENGLVTAVDAGETKLIVTSKQTPTVKGEATITVSGYANGPISYVKYSYEERTEILGKLEKYAVDTGLTGLPIYGDGGYVMYADNIQKGTNNYIPGYGFGILAEGDIIADLSGETVEAWKRYYHTYETDDPGTILYMNDKGSVVGDLVAYVASSYFDVRMNETKDGYEWYGALSKTDRPEPVNPDEFGFSKTFRFPVRVGSELRYTTGTNVERLAKYNNQEVQLQDYITPYQIYYTKAYGLERSAENLDGASSLAGTQAYYDKSADGFNAEAWKNVGIKSYVENGESYLEFTFNVECNTFYAMYYLSSGMFAPVPEQFILDCAGEGNTDLAAGVAVWGSSNNAGTEGPADHYLATGPYMFEAWNPTQNIVFKQNPNFHEEGRYNIKGVHVNIFPAAKDDENAAIKEFLDGKLSAAGIPQDYLADYKTDPRTTKTTNSSVYKLNLNTCNDELWAELFGVDGSVTQTAKSDYWECEPALNVREFVKGLNYSLDRKSISDTHGRNVGYEYFGDSYLSDPENGVSYNSTQAHKDAIADFVKDTDGFGYSFELAKANFLAASEQLVEEGVYKTGDTITLEIAWQTAAQAESYADITEDIETAFNQCGGPLQLDVVDWIAPVWSDVYYKKMMIGQFDVGFGSISGNPLNPINFLEVLKSDNSSGFTLNWGVDTSEVSNDLFYDNRVWSFDSLWKAADQGAVFLESVEAPLVEVESVAVVRNADGSLRIDLSVIERYFDDDNCGKLLGFAFYAYTYYKSATDNDYYEVYAEFAQDGSLILYDADGVFAGEKGGSIGTFSYDKETGTYTMVFDAAFVEAWMAAYPTAKLTGQGVDVYAFIMLLGEDTLASSGYFLGGCWSGAIPEIPQP